MIGTTISHYRILGTAGVGGMGVVYVAEDTRLNRKVALKFLPPAIASDEHARGRLLREAQAASALDHPNVATIYEIGEWQNQLFIAMAFYDGETLRQRIERGRLDVAEAAFILLQLATGLSAAHHAGIVHRDLKPANVMLTRDGHVKILDFGLARMISDSEQTALRLTGPGTTIGTVAYMAPEQAHSAEVDARADIWALGVMGFEMLTGRLPFNASTPTAALLSVARDAAPPIRSVRADVPDDIATLIDRALEKSPERRTVTADAIVAAVSAWQARSSSTMGAAAAAPAGALGRLWIAAAAIVAIATVAAFGWYVRQQSRARWARETALPEIERLVEHEQNVAAFALMNEAKRYIATDPVWARLDPIVWRRISITTTPPGATISYRDYAAPDSAPTILGLSPVTGAQVPNSPLAWRVEKKGFDTAEDVTAGPIQRLDFMLSEHARTPSGMVYARVGDAPYQMYIPGLDHLPAVKLRDFWIDRYEVSNRDFKKFVDDGGYRRRELWQAPFVKDGRELAFDDAMRLFTDSTGRPGPATWEQGRFPEGQDDLPVTGVSWFEAAAYAAYAGKSLPTIYHWSRAAEQRFSGFVVPRSNFSGRGAMKVGASRAMSRFGAVDMPGNVKEWCWNRADASRRYILGGAWDEPVYMANDPDARSPFERANNFGFRCVKYSPDESLAGADAELVAFEARDFSKETPVNDQGFELIRRMYAYDRSDLKPATESVDDSNADWRTEKISFAAAYGNERVPAFLFLPKNAKPPYQAVVFFPGSNVIQQRSSAQPPVRQIDFVIKSGRAVIFPVYKGTFERSVPTLTSDYPSPTNAFREMVFDWAKDVRRSVDYLETRPDIDAKNVAFMGLSWGAAMGPIYVALEPRFEACVLVVGGFYLQHSAPEVDAFNFAPRVHVPVLLLNGRFDFFYPMDTSQLPMFRLFGVPEAEKRRIIYDTGHNIPRPDLIRETLDWLDRYLGPVKSTPSP